MGRDRLAHILRVVGRALSTGGLSLVFERGKEEGS